MHQPDHEEAQARDAFARAREGERSAYGTVVRIYQHRLFNAVYRMVGNREDAAEVTQEAFTRGLEKMAEFRGDSGPYTWLFRIAMNAAVSRIRRSSRRRTVSLEAMDAPDGGRGMSRGRFAESLAGSERSPTEVAEMTEAHKAVVAAMDRLDPEYRALLVMRDMEGFDYRQMADVLGLPLGTLKSRLFRARMALRDLLEPQFRKKESIQDRKVAVPPPRKA
jgi:RNA polymerase sigma-70 factor (ECF subfamily)